MLLWKLFVVLPVNTILGMWQFCPLPDEDCASLMYMQTCRKVAEYYLTGNHISLQVLSTYSSSSSSEDMSLISGRYHRSLLTGTTPSFSLTHLFARLRALHCCSVTRAQLTEGTRAVPSSFGVVSVLLNYSTCLSLQPRTDSKFFGCWTFCCGWGGGGSNTVR